MNGANKQKILDILAEMGALSPAELAEALEISPQATHRHLKSLLSENKISKKGRPPTVYYQVAKTSPAIDFSALDENARNCVEQNFSFLSSAGELLAGLNAFEAWLQNTKQKKLSKPLSAAYLKLHNSIYHKNNDLGLFEISAKLNNTFSKIYFNNIFCSDFYSLPQFGRTHLGNLVTAGKSGQNKNAIKQIASIIQPQLNALIKQKKIDSICWIPHSISRKILFLPETKKLLKLSSFEEIKLVKVFAGDIPIAQKSLSKLDDRIENARETIVLKTKESSAKNVLMIDDALGSGATINESAKKIEEQLKIKNIYAYAVVGSYKGFDVLGVV